MHLNPTSGNMYTWADYTANPIKGICPHDCAYCYMKVARFKKLKPQRLVKSEITRGLQVKKDLLIKRPLEEGNTIFVGSSTDMWAKEVPDEWIKAVLDYCQQYPDNEWFFQTKNPERMHDHLNTLVDMEAMVGITVETNKLIPRSRSKAPSVVARFEWLKKLYPLPQMISIEPIMDFDLEDFVIRLTEIENLLFISIGANSRKEIDLPQPSPEKLEDFIKRLENSIPEVKRKKNLERLQETKIEKAKKAVKPVLRRRSRE